jgi:hypothetical protein
MAKVELELNDKILERARRLAEARHSTLDTLVNDVLDQTTARAASDPVLGLFSEEPDLVDQIVESAMEAREQHPLRQKRG